MGVRKRGRPRRGWTAGVIEILGREGLNIEETKSACKIDVAGAIYVGCRHAPQ